MKNNPHAVALGRRGGLAKSPAKSAAARKNGKRGGRPPIQDEFSDLPVSRQRKSQLRKLKQWKVLAH